jgi:Uma2 family endonuclease
MSTIVYDGEVIHIPVWVDDLTSFRRWVETDEFPETGKIYFLRGEVWVDMSKEQLFSHIKVKDQYTKRLDDLVEAESLGFYFSDGLRLSNLSADISSLPDGTFISEASLREGRVRLVPGAEEGFVEVEGTPDMVLEIVSRSSVHKDTVELFQSYWEAGIREYWLVDARKEPLRFDIFRHTAKGYVPTRKLNGWLKSAVFGKSFRLTAGDGTLGYPRYSLFVR